MEKLNLDIFEELTQEDCQNIHGGSSKLLDQIWWNVGYTLSHYSYIV
jgi:hypothetical protein